MTDVLRTARRILARLAPHGTTARPAPGAAVLDGLHAVAVTEARGAEAAALGGSAPADRAAAVWEAVRDDVNAFGTPRTTLPADSPRAALAAAVGLATSGQRATVFLAGPDLLAGLDLLAEAVRARIPLVVHLACRAAPAGALAPGTGHDAVHAAAGTGACVLVARHVQDAVDFTLLARRVAERALGPVVVAMDDRETALAAQDVTLPDDALVRAYLGEPSSRLPTPTEAQRVLFGPMRRLVPRWHDADRPLALGAAPGPESAGIGLVGRGPFFDRPLADLLDASCAALAERTGRPSAALVRHRTDGAKRVLVAQGSTVELAMAVADVARTRHGTKLGVVGVGCRCPFPGPALVDAVRGAELVVVLERTVSAPGAEGPLTEAVRAALGCAGAPTRTSASDPAPAYPPLSPKHVPRLIGVTAGAGGLPVRAADLVALVTIPADALPAHVVLGLDAAPRAGDYPRRQALVDALRRGHPGLGTLGVRAGDVACDVRASEACTVAVLRTSRADGFAGEAAAFMHAVAGGVVRSRPGAPGVPSSGTALDVWTITPDGAEGPADPGDDVPIDVLVALVPAWPDAADPLARLAPGATIIMGHRGSTEAADVTIAALPAFLRRAAGAGRVDLRVVGIGPAGDDDDARAGAAAETMLGGLAGVLAARRPEAFPHARARSVRTSMLETLPPVERETRHDAFGLGLETVRRIEVRAPDPAHDAPGETVTEAIAGAAGRSGHEPAEAPIDSPARFWNQTGVLYHAGATAALSPDPALTVGALPPGTSAFRDAGEAEATMAVFDPATCDGHGGAWTACPDGSVAPLAITPRALLDAGIELASAGGRSADALRPLVSKLARRMVKIMLDATPPTTAGALLQGAFEAVAAKAALTGERRAAGEAALAIVIDEVGALPIARTPAFFDEPERETAGTGALLALVVNPDAGRNPAGAVRAAAGRGLELVPRTPERVAAGRRLWRLYHRLPGTTDDTIERVRAHPDVGPLAAIMLSRTCLGSIAGGDAAPSASGSRLALQRVLAIATWHRRPRRAAQLAMIDGLRARLSECIDTELARALPTADLDALADGLDALGRRDVDLAALSGKVEAAVGGGHLDGGRLARIVDAARGLADLRWRLAVGESGAGRAPLGLVVGPGRVAEWAAAFPWNPFALPSRVDAGGETAALARGLFEGAQRQAVAAARVLRWARLELDDTSDAEEGLAALERLRASDLTAEERDLCPPLLVVASAGSSASRLAPLLAGDLPIKVLWLSDAGGPGDADDGRLDAALAATLGRRAFVVQTTLADDGHLVAGVLDAFAFDGPALIHLHAPSPQRDGFAPRAILDQAALAVASRAFPLFRFDPRCAEPLAAGFDLAGNPAPDEWLGARSDGRVLTPVDWAATQARFDRWLREPDPAASASVPVAEYLRLDADARATTRATVIVDGESRPVADALVADADARLRRWSILRGLAAHDGAETGVSGPAADDGADETARSAAAAGVEPGLADLRDRLAGETAERVTERLLALAGYAAPAAPDDGSDEQTGRGNGGGP